jgi:cell wall assembly regulator SMI1
VAKIHAGDVVEVHWVDSITYGGWRDEDMTREDMETPLPKIVTAGYLVHDGKEAVTISHSVGNNNVCDIIRIPKVAISKTTVLRKVKPPKG